MGTNVNHKAWLPSSELQSVRERWIASPAYGGLWRAYSGGGRCLGPGGEGVEGEGASSQHPGRYNFNKTP